MTISDEASLDIENIVEFGTGEWGIPAAQAYVGRIGKALTRIAAHPRIGAIVEDAPHLRRCSIGSHIIFYNAGDEELVVVRVLHASQEAWRHLP